MLTTLVALGLSVPLAASVHWEETYTHIDDRVPTQPKMNRNNTTHHEDSDDSEATTSAPLVQQRGKGFVRKVRGRPTSGNAIKRTARDTTEDITGLREENDQLKVRLDELEDKFDDFVKAILLGVLKLDDITKGKPVEKVKEELTAAGCDISESGYASSRAAIEAFVAQGGASGARVTPHTALKPAPKECSGTLLRNCKQQ